jgi:hypothetical protein
MHERRVRRARRPFSILALAGIILVPLIAATHSVAVNLAYGAAAGFVLTLVIAAMRRWNTGRRI